jgi:hypothetical protein
LSATGGFNKLVAVSAEMPNTTCLVPPGRLRLTETNITIITTIIITTSNTDSQPKV